MPTRFAYDVFDLSAYFRVGDEIQEESFQGRNSQSGQGDSEEGMSKEEGRHSERTCIVRPCAYVHTMVSIPPPVAISRLNPAYQGEECVHTVIGISAAETSVLGVT